MADVLACPTCGVAVMPGATHCPQQHPLPAPGASAAARKDSLVGMKCGEYDVVRPLGEGGMGFVYEGLQPMIGKRVAIKILRAEIAWDPEQMQRLLSEARTVNAVRHRGIVDIFSFGQLPDGRQYFVMELLDGAALDTVLSSTGRMSMADALPIVDEVLDALAAVHRVGVIHRDLKPSNIFVVAPPHGARYIKLLDFGLAKQAPVPGGTTPQTRASMLIGTPSYMAPEQARGAAIGPGTDLYAVGVMLYEMLVGALPFTAPTPFEVIYKHLNSPPPLLSSILGQVPPALDELMARLLAKKLEERPQTADEVRQALRSLGVPLGPIIATPVTTPQPLPATAGKIDPTFISRTKTDPEAIPKLDSTFISKPRADLDSAARRQLLANPSQPAMAASPSQPGMVLDPAQAQALLNATSQALAAPKSKAPWIALGAAGLLFAGGAGFFFASNRGPAAAAEPVDAPVVALPVAAAPPPPAAVEAPAPKAPEPPPAAAVGKLSISSNIPCEASVDGKSVGKTPVGPLELSPGSHTVECRNEFGGERNAKVEVGSASEHAFEFKKGSLDVQVLPYATVTIDGKGYGETPIDKVSLFEGTHTVELRMESKRKVQKVSVKAGGGARLKVNMEQ